ncbi:MAG: T9SS type A sorting domain-containing protein, partial [bacterium]|nr:T9SS type A sorting domain-containing protein [bacterium]
NDNGSVDFADFILFAQLFGQKVPAGKAASKSVAPYPGSNTGAAVHLVPQANSSPDQVSLAVHLTGAKAASAFNLTLHYDAASLQLMRAETAQASRFAQGSGSQPVVLQALSEAGGLILSDVFADALESDGTLLTLTFQVTRPDIVAGIDISHVLIADGNGNINALQGARLVDLNSVPSEFSLGQNQPNPFNPDTQIGYQLSEPGEVSLVIYNVLGQQVRQLVAASQPAGFYRVGWNGQDALGRPVSSGVYFYRLTAGSFSQTKMMVLLK